MTAAARSHPGTRSSSTVAAATIAPAPSAAPTASAHDRLLDAAVNLAGGEGYPRLTVERLMALSRVSRATFYQYFTDVDDCFWSAYRRSADGLVRDVAQRAKANSEPQLAVIDTLLDFASEEPEQARMLMRECLAAGSTGLLERDLLVQRIAQAMTSDAGVAWSVDMPAPVLIGGLFRFFTMHLTAGPVLREIRADLLEWVSAFVKPVGVGWSARFTPRVSAPAPEEPGLGAAMSLSGPLHERILRASTIVVYEKGYSRSTVDDIVLRAHTSRRSFYNEFSSKADAVIAAFERGFEQTLAVSAPAYFSSTYWPEQVWQVAMAFTGFFAREPAVAYLGFVECYALGGFATRVHETQLAFTLFLEEGYRQGEQAREPPRICSTMTTAVSAELGFLASRGSPAHMRRVLPLAVYVILTPFIGSHEAGRFVTGKLARRSDTA